MKKILILAVVIVGMFAQTNAVTESDVYAEKGAVASPSSTLPPLPCYNTDSPGCACFVDAGAWNPWAVRIQDVAKATIGTRSSCVADGGKPYYQMVLGCNSVSEAQSVALDIQNGIEYRSRGWWCSEAVAYWHRQARLPYQGGYRVGAGNQAIHWWDDWQISNVGNLCQWYTVEGSYDNGRGRWIDSVSINYDDFVVGINAPAPGSYLALREATIDASGNVSFITNDNCHSQMIDEMTIYKDTEGKITKIEVKIIEGNSGNQVKNTTVYDDLIAYCPQGSKWLGSRRKIYGFGVDLTFDHLANFDRNRLKVIRDEKPKRDNTKLVRVVRNDGWDDYHKIVIPKIIKFIQNMKNMKGPLLAYLPKRLVPPKGVPDGMTSKWVFDKSFKNESIEVTLDLRDEHPVSIRGVSMAWQGFVPIGFKMLWSGNDKKFKEASMANIGKIRQPTGKGLQNVYARFSTNPNGVKIRYVRLQIPKGKLVNTATLNDLRFNYRDSPLTDSRNNEQQ